MVLISGISLRQILDSRGNPTVEADVLTDSGGFGRAAAPSGASTGQYEAIELPASEAIAAARQEAIPRLVGEVHVGDQRAVDTALHTADGTNDFSVIGANSAVAISMAAAKAGANQAGIPLFQHLGGTFRGDSFPIPLGNVLGGGEHAKEATAIQEFLSAPVGAPNIAEAVFANAAVHARVSELLDERGIPAAKGDEGAWAPSISDDTAFEVVSKAVDDTSTEVGFDIKFGLDMAATEFFDADRGVYEYRAEEKSTAKQVSYVAEVVSRYDLAYVEDPLDENDYEGFAELTEQIGEQTIICGDDLFVTNVSRLRDGIEAGAGNAILIKPNQIGTLSDAFDAIKMATQAGYLNVVSHRSGETEDTTIAHLAVATAAEYIKTGTVQGERTAKLNELIRIADGVV
ncbi:MAG: phosphopyruvate hydratase [Haloquadratum sp. J07HQX50]|jgi:enolase (EC 4.2.1.11)|nr:MAG: phosphopyruvate hydratase [Haloquadratum sp. J07HQX50]